MKVVVLYRPNSEHDTLVNDFVKQYNLESSASIELIDVDSREGIQLVELYDALNYPAILVIQSDGQLQKMWTGNELPLVKDVVAYSRN